MKRGSFVRVILLAIAMVALTSHSAPSFADTTITTNTTSLFVGSVVDPFINDIVDVTATLHVVVNVSLDLSNPPAGTCSGVTNTESTYSATGRRTLVKMRIAVNTAYPDAPCPVPGASDHPILFNLFPVAGCEGLPNCGDQVFPAILWQQITVDASGALTHYEARFGTSSCDPFVEHIVPCS